MRRTERELGQWEEIRSVLEHCRVCRIGLQDEEGMYIGPLNFGWEMQGEELNLYFHSAREGRKLRAIATNPQVAFEMDTGHRLMPSEEPCGWSFRYESLIGNGVAQLVEDPAEKCRALSLLMRCQTKSAFSFTPQQAAGVAVIRLRVTRVTGKANR